MCQLRISFPYMNYDHDAIPNQYNVAKMIVAYLLEDL